MERFITAAEPYSQPSSGESAVAVIFFLVGAAVLFVLYFVPSGIAIMRGHHQVGAIIAINVFLGCFLVGWVVALAMALSSKQRPVVHQTIYQPPPGQWGGPPPPTR
jgi:hypothetical protein